MQGYIPSLTWNCLRETETPKSFLCIVGPAAACGGYVTFGSQNAASVLLPPNAGALWMYQVCQRWTQNCTVLLDLLVMASEDQLVDA
ncbi:hypothetical protein Y1Q_0015452 [Alligator mississippiensis]|uniref:Uncharacterized protein n=1 Tax=Alligator mississippiensis TaxID=8496 RepID=A0A151ND02_ALLMI|nr:hypothetical protein Y1Q_0015452 [Alligator mississippiensis]